ncbi:MAG: ABC-2 transporter permease [Ardenticatenaceae bacterium]|nr:ABC-2 transporter permease [Ardenticatenaceae bacterium]MCB9004499.1 ABC-2 transporter permease [Ardenticatenaceae bacterium]
MNLSRIFSLARRVMRQVLRDHRTIGLLVFVPMLLLTIGALLFRADPTTVPLGIVNEDEGATLPLVGSLNIGNRVEEALADSEFFELVTLTAVEVDDRLRDGTVQGVLLLPADFTTTFQKERQANLDLRLEGSNPSRSQIIQGRVTEAAMKALAGLAAGGFGLGAQGDGGVTELPVSVTAVYLFAGEQFDTMDFIAPVYIALLAMFFVFLLTCVSFLRERSQGTMERLLATPATRLEIVLGYMLGLGTFALVQVSIILFFTIWALKIHYLGSLGLLFIVVVLLALVGVSLGMLASAFARNEFQVVQFIPLLIIPQVLLGGTFWAVEDMPGVLQPFTYLMPLTYANWALRDIMLKGFGLGDIWPNLMALFLYGVAITGLGALTMRREVV